MLAIKLRTEAINNGYQVLQQIFFIIFGQIDHFYVPLLQRKESLKLVETKASGPIFMFHHHNRDGGVDSQWQKLFATVVNPGTDFLNNFVNLPAFGGAVVYQPFSCRLRLSFISLEDTLA